ncbi:MAG: RNA polymerase sigma factor [Saprospirales bacterium]|nr:RNA polymerase sigma factor [Saprospirales bacterium]
MPDYPNKRDDARTTPGPADLELAAACRAGDRRAQRDLWERYKNRMYGVCLRLAASPQEAEDWLQEAFIQVFRHIEKYRGEGSLEGWVRRVVVRTAIQLLKQQHLKTTGLDNERLERLLFEEGETSAGEEDEPGRLVGLLQQLPPGFRAVLNLYVLEERSHEEIARELNITVGTSKSQLSRAKAFLKRLIDKTLILL